MRTAVIGAGFMGTNHARVYSEISELVAVCDTDKQRAEEIAKKYGGKAYSNYMEMIMKEKLDAVSIVVPTSFHYKVALDLINAGVPILIEKPIAATVEDAEHICGVVEIKKAKVSIGHIERFNPVVSAAKNIIDEGMIGEVLSLRGVRVGPFTPRVKDAGVLHILAIHDFDMFSYLTASQINKVNCEAIKKRFSEFEDIVSINGLMANGVVFSLEANWTSPRKIRTLTVTGTKGILELDYITQRLLLTESDGGERSVKNYSDFLLYNVVGEQRMIDVQPKEPLKVELEAFLNYVKNGGPSPVSASAGLEALRLVEMCKEKIR